MITLKLETLWDKLSELLFFEAELLMTHRESVVLALVSDHIKKYESPTGTENASDLLKDQRRLGKQM